MKLNLFLLVLCTYYGSDEATATSNKSTVNNNSTTTKKPALLTPGNSFRLDVSTKQVHFHVQQGNLIPFWKRGKKRAESVINEINITLKDVYMGYSKPANSEKLFICNIPLLLFV